ncbi:hypothetical protein FRX31_015480 [Thalictrum thalictroides]|uniref:Reverse transcriptase zinc-binding domain-containing protein n=1 Tax=Thalictrum thalictroides TaxID=46969 RepID=A0A7J6WC30_THATH|nr:hypothetical protein FRX31_015480 [Thalictrum thalictroides]
MPIEYLGVPIFYGRAKAEYFEKQMNKVRKKLDGWRNKLLTRRKVDSSEACPSKHAYIPLLSILSSKEAPLVVPMDCPQYTLHDAAVARFNLVIIPHDIQQNLIHDYNLLKSEQHDRMVWPHANDGNFSIKSYVKMAQEAYSGSAIFRRVWQHYIPTKISLFFWKLLNEAIPTDNAVKKCNITLASRCVCCQFPSEESCKHLLCKVT